MDFPAAISLPIGRSASQGFLLLAATVLKGAFACLANVVAHAARGFEMEWRSVAMVALASRGALWGALHHRFALVFRLAPRLRTRSSAL